MHKHNSGGVGKSMKRFDPTRDSNGQNIFLGLHYSPEAHSYRSPFCERQEQIRLLNERAPYNAVRAK